MKRYWILITTLLIVIISVGVRLSIVWHWDFSLLFSDPDTLPLEQATLQMAILPEMAVAFLAGGLLSLSSTALQQIVRNNLASDSTLAVSSGAQLMLMATTLFIPSFGLFGSFWVAFSGAVIAMLLVLFIAKANGMNPIMIILSGLIVNIVFGAVAAVIVLFYNDLLLGIMIWGSGSLLQDGWATTITLLWATLVITVIFILLQKPLTLLSLDDAQARRLGVPVNTLRYSVLIFAAAITALVVSEIGVIGFIGLAGASCVQLLNLHRFASRLFASFFMGGMLLLMTDNLANLLELWANTVLPTGSLTSILGAPLLIYLVLKQRKSTHHKPAQPIFLIRRLSSYQSIWFGVALVFLLFCVLQGFAPGLSGWQWQWQADLIFDHRLPRSLSAVATGAMLAVGGALLQTLTRNPMASPEVLGISSGTTLAVIMTFLFFPAVGSGGLLFAGVIGSVTVLLLIMFLSRKLQPSALLLTGIAISALTSSVTSLVQISGNPKLTAILSWISGSTYYAQPHRVWLLVLIAVILISFTLLLTKPLRVLSLGQSVARNLGLSVQQMQHLLLFLVALMSAVSTLAVGPLSFVGLITPHLAKKLGAVTPEMQLPLVAVLGAGLMLIADWLGRYVIFPYEIGAGVIASLVGGIYFLLLVRQHY